ncbi:MAG: exodeoxyribonuclease I [Pseudomonadales bacterium]|nr:exodeoxyribonuclease I [Pseudomonadales bacterium]
MATDESNRQGGFYWYDLETSGTDAKWDRIVQFAGLRTDAELNETGDAVALYVQLPDDVLPNPDAALVTGITPALTVEQGVTEWQAIQRIHALFAAPGTCVAGYNSLRFDDEFVRYALYRNLMDPYAREWQHGNSRWDIIDLVRATGALRRDGIEWPTDEAGLPVYKLERLTVANGIEHGNAHDAMSDVRATVALARLVRRAQPRLFDYYLGCRSRKQVRALLEPYGARLCVHVSGMYPRERLGVAPIMSLGRHPTNGNSVVVADLSQDIESLLEWPEERIRAELYRPANPARPPLKEIRVNRCPFVAGIEVLTDENWRRLGCGKRDIEERQRRLRKPGIAQKILRVFRPEPHAPAIDPEAALYDGFIDDADRSRSQVLQRNLAEGRWMDLDYTDRRLTELAVRLKARSFPQLLAPDEALAWREFVRDKLTAAGPWLGLARFRARLAELANPVATEADPTPRIPTPRERELLAALAAHGDRLARDYALPD